MTDVAIAYNQELRCCDVVFNGRDFALDETPASAMLFSVLAQRRARPDDVVPTVVTDWSEPSSLTARGGTPCDALDPNGQLSGSRVWLYVRSPASPLPDNLAGEATRQGIETAIAESVSWLETIRGFALSLRVRYVAASMIGFRLRAGNTAVQLKLPVGG
jgi:hypothetical protein